MNGISSKIKSLWKWWVVPPPNFTSSQRRRDSIAAFSYGPSWLIHFLYVLLFTYWGVWPLAIFNIFNVIIIQTGLIIFWRWRREKITYSQANLMYWVVALETFAQSALIIHYLGWGFGFQYFLFFQAAVSLTAPRPRWINILVTITDTILFVLFYYYTQFNSPLFMVQPLQLATMNIIHISITFAFVTGIVAFYIFLFKRAEAALKVEHAKSEALLNNVLPKSIAVRLKQDNATIAEGFVSASILFADIAGFTPFSQQIGPEQLVNVLDNIFSRFDELVDEYGLEKIKTIGDAYMVASGIPIPREDHAEALAHFAIAMREALADYNRFANTDLQLRIGINSGPVVAGVIGKSRFIYDLWGDSVNTASRMESHGQSGEIQITEATRQLLDGKFSFIDRGMIEVKGKGMMQTYFINAEKTQFFA